MSHIGEIIRLRIVEEVKISHFLPILADVVFAHSIVLLGGEVEPKGVEHLAELFGRNLKPVKFVPVFKVLLGLQPVHQAMFSKLLDDKLGDISLFRGDLVPCVHIVGTSEFFHGVGGSFFQQALVEDLINSISEVLPSDETWLVFASEMLLNQVEFPLREGDLAHVHGQPELILRDVPVTQLIEISHEVGNPDPFFFDLPSDLGQKIVKILWIFVRDGGCVGAGSLLKPSKAAGIGLGNLLRVFVVFIHISDELVVVDLVEVALVHISLE